ncbi:Aspartic peptidase [Parasponia andersonii]|uniref:Aspartic peptidase n=1 Tax=Parasponia andersonii TaxID=3476 RepID=A0A2P5DKW4_PARAD|nr:Aspartic peptidase [Parasponia andersonii]
MIDSGSDDKWVQGEGCKTCFEIKGKSSNFQGSPTFRYLPCDYQLCVPKLCQSGHCVYDIRYLGSTAFDGVVSSDTFSFATDYISIPNVVFVCGFESKNINFGEYRGPNNIIAEVFGLGYGKRSILRQLDSQTNDLSSYCLPS